MTAGSALIDTSTLGAFLLAAARATGLALTAPVIGDGTTPVRARLVFVLATAAAVAPVIPAPPLAAVAAIGLLELAAGLVIGWIARLAIHAVAAGGQLVGLAVGLGFASEYDPSAGESASVVRQLIAALAGLGFLAAGGLEALVRAVAAPPVTGLDLASLGPVLIDRAAAVLADGVALAAPALFAALVINLGMALAQRAAPALHVFAINFTVVLLVGALVLWSTAHDLAGRVGEAGRTAAAVLQGGAP